MSISQGRKGKITCRTTVGGHTIAELGTWSISGQEYNMIEHTAFGDLYPKVKPGMRGGADITFSGYWDASDSSGQKLLYNVFSSGKGISSSSGTCKCLRKMRVWANSSSGLGPKGFWGCTGSTGAKIYITQIDLSQDKAGLGTVAFTAKVAGGALKWTSAT